PPVGVSKACSSCVRTADVKEACTQCDQFVCQSCSRLCSCCNAVTCSLCSTIDYGDVGEQVLCNGCSIFQV
ncbi:Apoptosis regulatory protein Siva, partial [Egretta garzetta]